jgi:mannonate dehydratase
MTNRAPHRTIGRRDFARIPLGTLGAASPVSRRGAATERWPPGIKLCVQSAANPSDEQQLFLKQLGAPYVSVGSPDTLWMKVAR